MSGLVIAFQYDGFTINLHRDFYETSILVTGSRIRSKKYRLRQASQAFKTRTKGIFVIAENI